MGPRAGLERCGKSRPHRDSIPDQPAHNQSLYRLSYPARCFIKEVLNILVFPEYFGINRATCPVVYRRKVVYKTPSGT